LAHQFLAQESNSTAVEETSQWFEPAIWTLALVLFFFTTYIAAGWVTAQRSNVPSVVFSWEHYIPFVPWTIIPYWSTDLFFITAPFLFRTRSGLRTYGTRILAVQVISIVIFLVFPLQFSFGRPHVDGFLGQMFALRTGIDTQFNQAPSLHIGFAVILWLAFKENTRGWLWRIVQVLLIAMSLSTLTTYRHHFIDLPTGLWAGVFSAFSISEKDWTAQRRFHLSIIYVLGAIIFVWASYRAGHTRWLVLWPAGLVLLLTYRRGQPGGIHSPGY
jgi:hypothetical protein